MRTLYLHGRAAEFGEKFVLDAESPPEMILALSVQLPGFREMIESGSWHVIRGPLDGQDADDEERLTLTLAERAEVHLVPAISGAGGSGGGGLMTIVGVILIAVASFYTGGTAAALYGAGAGMVLGGIVSMTTKIPGADTNQESKDNRSSFLLSTPTNRSTQGVPIPRGYGRCIGGSIVVSVGLTAEATTEDTDTTE